MFTIEMDTDEGAGTTIVTLDDKGENDDVEVVIYEDQVFIRQIDEHDGVQMILLSPQQLRDIVSAMNLPAGAYYQKTSLLGEE